jgi:hypothetical protein
MSFGTMQGQIEKKIEAALLDDLTLSAHPRKDRVNATAREAGSRIHSVFSLFCIESAITGGGCIVSAMDNA